MTSRDETDVTAPARTNPLAIAALVCGIVQFGAGIFKGLGLAGIAAIILGHVAVRQIRRSGESGRRLAKAGLILGYAGLALALFAVVIALISSNNPALPTR
jgi:predicted PurR-regulated permease PerM